MIRATNHGTTTCVLRGLPGLEARTAPDTWTTIQLGIEAAYDPWPSDMTDPTDLAPGHAVLVLFSGSNRLNYEGSMCPADRPSLPPADAYRLVLPDGTTVEIDGFHPGDWQNNFGHIGSPELNTLIDQTLSELDPKKAIDLANEVDRKVFEEGHSLPLTQSEGNWGVRSDIANFGSPGLASYDYTKIGFVK